MFGKSSGSSSRKHRRSVQAACPTTAGELETRAEQRRGELVGKQRSTFLISGGSLRSNTEIGAN